MKKQNVVRVTAAGLIVAGILGGYGIAKGVLSNSKAAPQNAKAWIAAESSETVNDSVDETSFFEETEEQSYEGEWNDTLSYEGCSWTVNRKLTTVLFMGVDSQPDELEGELLGTGGRADTLLLLILDESNQTMKVLQLSRDTITEVDVYDAEGEYLYSGDMQLCMQYAYGVNPSRSCWLTKNTVSELLYGIPIDFTFSLTLKGLSKVTELIGQKNGTGGLTVTLEDDWTDVDPTYVKGASIVLTPDEMDYFIRQRDTDAAGSNERRMERTAWFFRQVLALLQVMSRQELLELMEAVGDDVITDMDAETLLDMKEYTLEESMLVLPGESASGNYHDEFLVDGDELRKLLIETFYVKEGNPEN